MKWKQEYGGYLSVELMQLFVRAGEGWFAPGALLAICERESAFQTGQSNGDGTTGPMGLNEHEAENYVRHAGFAFALDGWDSVAGAAAVLAAYASLGQQRHGLQGDDRYRFAIGSLKYGLDSEESLAMDNAQVAAVERKMRFNGLWYDAPATKGLGTPAPLREPVPGRKVQLADEAEKQAYIQRIARAAADWAYGQLGAKYSQTRRREEGYFDCSSLVARAFLAAGSPFTCRGAPIPNSTNEVYDDQLRLLVGQYDSLGKVLYGNEVLNQARQVGDLFFACTLPGTNRANKITHVGMWYDERHFIQARGSKYGVVLTADTLYDKKIVALARFDPFAPLQRGMRGDRVRALQRWLVEQGAKVDVDGSFGPATQAAVEQYDMPDDQTQLPGTPGLQYGVCTSNKVNIRSGPGLGFAPIGQVDRDHPLLVQMQVNGWRRVVTLKNDTALDGYISADYVQPEE